MLHQQVQYVYPKTIKEVLEFLKEVNSKIVAGASAVSLHNNSDVSTFIDIQYLPLSYIKDVKTSFKIGAMTSSYDIYMHPDLPNSLKIAADKIGDIPLLHAVTVGGNLAVLYPWVDLPPVLWALDASITVHTPEKQTMKSDDYFAYVNKRNIDNRKNFIEEIEVPKSPKNSFDEYQSLTLIENEKGQLNLASYFEWDDDKTLSSVRLVLSAATKDPMRLSCENDLLGKKITDDVISNAVKSISSINIVPHYKSSKEYRSHILGVFLKRTLNNCQRAMEEKSS